MLHSEFIKSFGDMQKTVHNNAKDHGWWETDRSIGELLMLTVSELAEAMEEARSGKPLAYVKNIREDVELAWDNDHLMANLARYKPEGLGPELADVVIRVMDIAERYNIDLGYYIVCKHLFNETRPYKHGGKLF